MTPDWIDVTRLSRRGLFLGAAALALPGCDRGKRMVMARRTDGATTPVRIVGPLTAGAPVAVLSHGLGARGGALRWLAEALAGHGFRCALPTHRETGPGALADAAGRAMSDGGLRGAVAAKVADPALEQARLDDIAAALTVVDPDRRAPFRVLIGHSMGAAATMIEAGAVPLFGAMGHEAFDAYVAISPEGPGSLFGSNAWSGVARPVLIVTGTRDGGTEGDWRWRASAFDHLPAGGKRLAIIPDANHLQLGGAGAPGVRATVSALVLEFVDQARGHSFAHSTVTGAEIREK